MDKRRILEQIMEAYGFESRASFARHLGVASTTMSSWFSRNTFDHDILYAKLHGVNPIFLFTGAKPVKIKSNTYKVDKEIAKEVLEEGVNNYERPTDTKILLQAIPYYDLEAVAGIVPVFTDTSNVKPVDHLYIPNISKCDGALRVVGDSMYPLLKAGDIVVYKLILDIPSDIYWGEMYLVGLIEADEDFVTAKYIQKSELGDDYIKLVSQNKHHQDKDVKLDKIRGLARIKASVRYN